MPEIRNETFQVVTLGSVKSDGTPDIADVRFRFPVPHRQMAIRQSVKVDEADIPGRSGKIKQAVGYEDTEISISLQLVDEENRSGQVTRSAMEQYQTLQSAFRDRSDPVGDGENTSSASYRTDGNENSENSSSRVIPPTRYSDIVGQDDVVDAVRDRIELPLKYADLFQRIGAKPQAGGVILAGPPGTGKTLLARAVAGECDAHIESVSGPELLSKWVGATEEALRTIFERAREFSPSIILFDEIDSLAVSRGSADAQYQKNMVTQLLALLDGLEERGKVFVIATTNRPDDIDSALRRPGRFDQVIHMGPPDERGRIAIFRHYLKPLVLDPTLDRDCLATDLASHTPGFTGADIAHFCQNAARICVKEASRMESPSADISIAKRHFQQALEEITATNRNHQPTIGNPIRLPRRDEAALDQSDEQQQRSVALR